MLPLQRAKSRFYRGALPMRIIICLSLLFSPALLAQTEEAISGREESLSGIVQLTSGFEKAGEAYFSPDMNWIIFQATPKGQPQYQMYVAS